MINTLDMQSMRYLNLFAKITRIPTRFYFKYNENLVFCVPKSKISQAVGEEGKNVKKLNYILRKKIKIIARPMGIQDVKNFIGDVVKPTTFKDLEIRGNEIIITAGMQNKAALIGRNKRRFLELQKIARGYFDKDLRIV